MPDPSAIAQGFTNIFAQFVPIFFKWLGRILIAAIIIGFFWLIYIFFQYKYKIIVFLERGTGKDKQPLGIGRISRMERAREIKQKGILKWKLLFARKKIEPVEADYIYPGNTVLLHKIAPGKYVPAAVNIMANPEMIVEPVSRSDDFWAQVESQQVFLDYQKKSGWELYGHYIIGLGAIIVGCLFVGGVIYLTYSHANQVVPALQSLSESIRVGNIIESIKPG